MTVWYLTMQYIIVIYLTIQCNIVQYSTIHYYIVQYISIYYIMCTIWNNILFSFISMLSLISHHLRQLYSVPLFWLLRNCCTILALPIESVIMDGFWHSRCLNDCIDFPDMIGSFASGANASLVLKLELKIVWLL